MSEELVRKYAGALCKMTFLYYLTKFVASNYSDVDFVVTVATLG